MASPANSPAAPRGWTLGPPDRVDGVRKRRRRIQAVSVTTSNGPSSELQLHVRYAEGLLQCSSILAADTEWEEPAELHHWLQTAPRLPHTRISGDPCATLAQQRMHFITGPTVKTLTGQDVPVPPYVDADTWATFAGLVVVVPGRCSLWLGNIFGDGYGRWEGPLAGGGKGRTMAHRFAYSAFHGPVEPGQVMRHMCEEAERTCVPLTLEACDQHLLPGDHVQNAADRSQHGRSASRRHAVRGRRWVDTRTPYERTRAVQAALRLAIADGMVGPDLTRAYDEAVAAGDPWADQQVLFSVDDQEPAAS